jgi:hypothetical protein
VRENGEWNCNDALWAAGDVVWAFGKPPKSERNRIGNQAVEVETVSVDMRITVVPWDQ